MKKYALVSLVSVALAGFFFNSQNINAQIAPLKSTAPLSLNLPTQAPQLKLGEPLPANLFVELAKAINPSVVNISTSAVNARQMRDPMAEMLERFYGYPPQQEEPWNNKPQRVGLGTGFIVREDGLIVTNAHVIRNADIIEVQLTENADKQYVAEVIGSDARTDIALIKIKPDIKLTAATLGSSKDLQVGEWVAAFGNPYGHGHTMTKGIISSKGRAIQELNKFPLLQTDASINPGNSGGPLVNSSGRVIGINSAIDARAQGIGFAIPIDEVKMILPRLEKGGLSKRGFLGVDLADLDQKTVAYLSLDEKNQGSLIRGILANGPAEKAGLKNYDVIVEIEGTKVQNSQHLVDLISDYEPGKKIKVRYLRNNRGQAAEKTASITIEERPSEKEMLRRSRPRR